ARVGERAGLGRGGARPVQVGLQERRGEEVLRTRPVAGEVPGDPTELRGRLAHEGGELRVAVARAAPAPDVHGHDVGGAVGHVVGGVAGHVVGGVVGHVVGQVVGHTGAAV